eukprot:gene26245-biopygen15249
MKPLIAFDFVPPQGRSQMVVYINTPPQVAGEFAQMFRGRLE